MAGLELLVFGFEVGLSLLEMVEPFLEFVVLLLGQGLFGLELTVSVIKVGFLLFEESLKLSHLMLKLYEVGVF